MLEHPHIVTTKPQRFAGLRLTIPKAAIQHEMGPGLREVHAALAAQGVTPAGPWFTHHFRIEADRWDFEVCVPIDRDFQAAGRVVAAEWATTTVARAVHRGGFEGLGAAWAELDGWVAAQSLEARGDLWEVYAVGPESNADPAAWRTELSRLVAGR